MDYQDSRLRHLAIDKLMPAKSELSQMQELDVIHTWNGAP